MLQSWIHTDYVPRLILSESLTIQWANHAANKALSGSEVLLVKDGKVACREEALNASLRTFIKGCDHVLRTFFITDEDSGTLTLLRARTIPVDKDRERAFGVIFFDDSAEFLHRYLDVAKVFKLTAAEYDVVRQLLSGETAEDITRKVGVSMATTRSHIRNIYRKLGVSSREALFKRLQPFRF